MSSIGFPDGQRITQWLGAPLVQAAALVIDNVLHEDGPFNLASWASVIVAVKATGGNVTVTIRQKVSGGPAALELDETFAVPAGATLFESVVLFGDAVYLDLTGSAVGTSVDYALYPSNTTTNAQVLASATVNFQHNEVLIAAEPTLDLVDTPGVIWTPADDAANTRMKVSAKSGYQLLGDVIAAAGGQASLSTTQMGLAGNVIPNTYKHLRLMLKLRGTSAAATIEALLNINNDAAADYDYVARWNALSGATGITGAAAATAVSLSAGTVPAAGGPSAFIDSGIVIDFPDYTDNHFNPTGSFQGWGRDNATRYHFSGAFSWGALSAISRLDITPSAGLWAQYSRMSLYGYV